MQNYKFYKDSLGWFIHLPESGFDKMDLQMVAGADTFCDMIAQGDDNIFITLSATLFEGCEVLEFEHYGRLEAWEMGEGAWYKLRTYKGQYYDLSMWLCDVTKYIFGELPERIYFI